MRKERWLQREIDLWKRDSLISEETASTLKHMYEPKRNLNILMVIFSIVGALLVGTGVILIGARNWYEMPVFLRLAGAFLPLIVAQVLAVYTFRFKRESLAWCESVALFWTASIFAVNAMVGQIFNISDPYGVFYLICALLTLPIMYILNAASPLLVYYAAIVFWAARDQLDFWVMREQLPINALYLFLLFVAGAVFLKVPKKQEGVKLTYLAWITALAGFAVALVTGIILESNMILLLLSFFVLLLAVNGVPESIETPFRIVGTLGSFTILAVLSYSNMWRYVHKWNALPTSFALGIICLALAVFLIRLFLRDKLRFGMILSLILVCFIRFVWSLQYDPGKYSTTVENPYVFMILTNVVMLLLAVGFIVHGVKNISLLTTNLGMAALCALILIRFFDSDMDILWRGVAFLILGGAFLLVNLKLLQVKKRSKGEVSV